MSAPASFRTTWRAKLGAEGRAAHAALSFLTTAPLPQLRPEDAASYSRTFARASAYYPLAGYLVGGAVALVLWLPLPLPSGVRGALGVSTWLLISGLLHFDGLVDSADALLSATSPARRLEILKDVHVGAFGLAAGVLTLLTLWSLLTAALPPQAPLVAAVLARGCVLLPMQLYPPARSGPSLGASARTELGWRWWLAAALCLPALALPGSLRAAVVTLLGTLLLWRWAAGRLGGGLTGDSYGLIIVSAEVLGLGAYAWGLH